MYIELVSYSNVWDGDNGVVMTIRAKVTPEYTTVPLPVYPPLHQTDSTEIEISISGLGEVRVALDQREVSITSEHNQYMLMSYVRRWLDSTGLLLEWGKETSRYVEALSRVDIPFRPQRRGKQYLSYSLKIGHEDRTLRQNSRALTLDVQVHHLSTYITIHLINDTPLFTCKGTTTSIASVITKDVITVDTLKAVVIRELDKLWGIVDLPMTVYPLHHE